MSLREAYSLVYTAQCRLNRESSRTDRSLRFVVGHLMHYESLRLRIADMEKALSRPAHSTAVTFSSDSEHIEHKLQYKPSIVSSGRRSPPPTSTAEPYLDDDTDSDHDSDYSDDDYSSNSDYGDGDDAQYEDDFDASTSLALSRFPSGSARSVSITNNQHTTHAALCRSTSPPELGHDSDDSSDEDSDFDYEPTTPDEPTAAALAPASVASKRDGERVTADLADVYRKCMFLASRTRGSACGREWGREDTPRTAGEVEVA